MKRLLFALAAASLVSGTVFWLMSGSEPPAVGVPTIEKTEEKVAEKPAAPAPAAAPTSAELPDAEAESFSRQLEAAALSLPTIDAIQALPKAAKHRPPPAVLEAGVKLGEIEDRVDKNPALAPKAAAFFESCAKNPHLALSVRAICLTSLRNSAAKHGTIADETGISAEVSQLAKKLQD